MSSKCFPAVARNLDHYVRRFEGVFGGLLESCSSHLEVGRLLYDGGVSADATVLSSPAPQCIGVTSQLRHTFQALGPK